MTVLISKENVESYKKYRQTVGVQVDVNETELFFFLILETVSGVTLYKTSLLSTQHSMQPDETA